MEKVYVGIDIGSVSAKAVALNGEGNIVFREYIRTFGRPVNAVEDLLAKLRSVGFDAGNIVLTGTGSCLFEYHKVNELKAISLAMNRFHREVRTVFEMGGESSKFIRIDDGRIVEYGVNGDCAAGTGSFIDQQAERLHYKVEEVGPLVVSAGRSARVAGRCSVFAKSDMIHAQQKGYSPPEVLKGLCHAVVRNFKATIVKGRNIEPRVAFIGGLALNEGVVNAVKEAFDLSDGQLLVPENAEFFGAIGAACLSADGAGRSGRSSDRVSVHHRAPSLSPLSTSNVRFLRDRVRPYDFPAKGIVDAYLGIDIGSVSTNFVVIDRSGDIILEIYTYTRARPIEVVSSGLKEIKEAIGDRISICGVGTTGSGRELIGELIGADVIKDEITAHKTGAVHICRKMTGENVDTIFEIGGQDAKYIRIDNGIVTDFAMNEACAAGTGSFLEEQAQRLGVSIKQEFAELALSSKAPISLGERCTVFMERDVNAYQLKGAAVRDIVAGLAYSVATNYLNRVVRGRRIGDHIFFQGGTAYNDAVAAAFSQILGKTITVPPHNGVIGAIGAALLARDQSPVKNDLDEQVTGRRPQVTRFRGYDIGEVSYTMREFACNACANSCDIQEFNVEGEKTYWGDKCSNRFRKKAHTGNVPVIEDLLGLRERLLVSGRQFSAVSAGAGSGRTTVGIPRAMFYYDRFPFWRAYFETLGFNVVVSDGTNKTISHDGTELSIAEPCYPIKLVHGHIRDLVKKGVDLVFIPNVISAEYDPGPHIPARSRTIPYLCPWHQTLPYIMKNHKEFSGIRFIVPTVQFELGADFVTRCMWDVAKELKVSAGDNQKAVRAGYDAQNEFSKGLQKAGREALNIIDRTGSAAIVLVGRPYNIYDLGANLAVPKKLREYYGMNLIPLDMLPVDDVDISDICGNMFWDYGRKIVAAAKIVAGHKGLHMIYITNFKCGPDSFIKHFASWAGNKPYLTLQFDEHANDAGIITRIEAYLDSKGLLKRENNHQIVGPGPQMVSRPEIAMTGTADIV